jgi:hypothetical protein
MGIYGDFSGDLSKKNGDMMILIGNTSGSFHSYVNVYQTVNVGCGSTICRCERHDWVESLMLKSLLR